MRSEGRFTLYYKFQAENTETKHKVKIEINTREHFSVLGYAKKHLKYQSDWHSADCFVTTYELEELLGTKLRALYQRKKGRDFFDLAICLELFLLDINKLIYSFNKYLEFNGATIRRANLEENIYLKLTNKKYLQDLVTILPKGLNFFENIEQYKQLVYEKIIIKFQGEPWKGEFTKCLINLAEVTA